MKIKAYRVYNCKVSKTELWSGVILKEEKETIIDAIKRRLNRNALLCEVTNEGFGYDEISFNEISFNDISIADYIVITRLARFDEIIPVVKELIV